MGNRGNARASSYDNSWKFTIWYSGDAVRQDLKQRKEERARVLVALQRYPLALARYIVQKYDKEQQQRQERTPEGHTSLPGEEFENVDGTANSQMQGSVMISKQLA